MTSCGRPTRIHLLRMQIKLVAIWARNLQLVGKAFSAWTVIGFRLTIFISTRYATCTSLE